jgi:hypothetical protein
MTDAGFPGTGQYFARLEAWYSGYRVYGRLTVFKTAGYGYFTNSPVEYGAHAAGAGFNNTWTYNFQQYSSKVVAEWSQPVGGPGNYTVDGWVDMAGFGRADPAPMTVTIPPNAPAAPGKPGVERNADNNIAVSWRDVASVAAPYEALQVQRTFYDGNWSGWHAVADDIRYNPNSGDRGYSDQAGVANRIYAYRIKVANSAGEAYSPTTSWVFTTPRAPQSVAAVKQSSGSIVISWTRGTPHTEIVTDIEYSTNGGTSWTSLTTGQGPTVTSYTMTTPPSGSSIKFRLRHRTTSTDPNARGVNLPSAWSESNSVGLTAPPLAPSALDPNGSAFDAATAKTFNWQHNTADSSTQTAYEIQYRIGSAAWTTTGKVTSTASARQFPANAFVNGNSYQWQVRTWGAHADPSPWSSTATFSASASPTVTITSPEASLALAAATAVWVYTDPEGTAQSAWEAELLRGGQVIEQRSGSGSASSVAFATRLDDATAYQVRVRVRDGSLLWSAWDQRSFTTSFPSPATPVVVTNFNAETGMATISVVNQTVSGKPTVVQNAVMRSTDGGQNWTQITTAPPNGIAFDPTIPLATDVLYKVVAESALPSFSESTTSVVNSEYSPWAVELTNLVPNPSFEAAGDTTELYRNYFSDPGATGSARFTSYAGTTGNTKNDGNPNPSPTPIWWSSSGTARRTRWTAVASPDTGDFGIQVGSQGGVALVGAGETWTIEYDIATSRTLSVNTPVPYASSGSYTVIARSHNDRSTVVGGYPEHRWVTFTADQTAIDNGLRIIQNPLGKQVDDYVEIGNVELYPGARRPIPFFSGSAAPKYRRNFFPNPEAVSTAGFDASTTQASVTHTGTAVRYTLRDSIAAGLGFSAYAPIQGVEYRLLVRARASVPLTAQLRIGNTNGPNVTIERDWQWFDLTRTAGNGTIYQTGILLGASAGHSAEDWVEVDRVLIAPSGDTGPWWGPSSGIDGLVAAWEGAQLGSALYLTDPDFTPTWTGAANNSQSIIQASRPATMGDNGILSSRWAKSGQRSARVFALGTNADTFVSPGGGSGALRLGMQAGKTYTAIATVRLFAPQTGTIDARARRIVVFYRSVAGGGYATIRSDAAPNAAGETELRLTFTLPAGAIEAFIRLYNGASRDNGEVYWDNFALVEGAYDGPYFDGNSTDIAEDTQYDWLGQINASSSVKTTRKFIGSDGGYWTAGTQFNEVVRMRRGQGAPPKIDLQTSVAQKTLQYFAGRTKPVELAGTAESRVGTVEFVVTSEDQMWQARRMALLPAPHLFRLPDRTHIFASMGPMTDTRLADGWYKLSFTITEVEQ